MNLRQQRRHMIAFMRWYKRQENRAYRFVMNWLATIETEVVEALREYGVEKTLDALNDQVADQPILYFLTRIYQHTVVEAAKRELTRLRVLSVTGTAETVSVELGFFSARWQTTIGNMLRDEQTASRITKISESTRKQIRDVLVQANADRVDVRTAARRLKPVLSGNSNRALLIARTETTRAASAGAELGAMSSSLLLNKIWIPTLDSRTRPSHAAMVEKKPVPRDGFFLVGGKPMKYPGDPIGGAAETAGCRCTQAYVPAINKV